MDTSLPGLNLKTGKKFWCLVGIRIDFVGNELFFGHA